MKEKKMKKTFKFHAKQGQHSMICALLVAEYGIKAHCTETSEGVRVEMVVPQGVSKSSIDRFLHSSGVPGAKEQKRLPIVSGSDSSDVMYKALYKGIYEFTAVIAGKFCGKKFVSYRTMCECCGPVAYMEDM